MLWISDISELIVKWLTSIYFWKKESFLDFHGNFSVGQPHDLVYILRYLLVPQQCNLTIECLILEKDSGKCKHTVVSLNSCIIHLCWYEVVGHMHADVANISWIEWEMNFFVWHATWLCLQIHSVIHYFFS